MPETIKLDEREDSSSGAEEPVIGAKGAANDQAGASSPQPEPAAKPQEKPREEAGTVHDEPPSDVPEDAEIHDFADSIALSLEQAGIAIGDIEPPARQADRQPPLDEDGETGFFAGWDGLDEIQELTAAEEIGDEREEDLAPQPFEDLVGRQTLSEISQATAASRAPDRSGRSGDLSSKHDELADAVQLALSNIYGNNPFPAPSPRQETLPPKATDNSVHWAGKDSLSPQDVILNYFSYETGTEHANGSSHSPLDRGDHHDSDAIDDFDLRPSHEPSDRRPNWAIPSPRRAAYDGPPSYLVPASYTAPSRGDAVMDRESSRLLGAAAIGLVGGIAIAASLAVFVINFYGPGGKTAPGGANRALEASESGYGRRLRSLEENDARNDAASPPAQEEAPSITAADVVAIPGQPSALAIGVKPDRSSEQTLVSITGVPDGARLNAGVDAGGGNWLLPPRRLNGLTINVPASTSDNVVLGVQLLDSNVRTPLSDKKQFALRVNAPKPEPAPLDNVPRRAALTAAPSPEAAKPAQAAAAPLFSTQTISALQAAKPDQPEPQAEAPQAPEPVLKARPVSEQPAAARQAALAAPTAQPAQPKSGPSQSEIEDLIREGNKRMREGDILEARQLYQKAVASGNPEAALAMGRSFDPIYFARIDKKNAEPDAAKAFDWYRKAMDGGAVQTAKVRIDNLKHFLNE